MGDAPQYSSCLWCSDTSFMQSHLCKFIRPPSRKNRPPWLKQAEADLCICVDCMEEYHKLVQEAFESDSRFLDMKEQVYRSDTSRLEKYMKQVLQEHADGFEDDVDSIPMTQKTAQLQASLKAPVREILKYPRLLLSESVSNQFVQVFYALSRVDESLEIEEKFPGMYLLLVFPDYQVRRWALNTVKSLGTLDWDDYDELEEVIKWLITVITFNLFVDPIQDVGSAAWKDEECVQLPKHLYTHSSPKDYWLGICSLVTAMDAECIRSRLMSSTSGHQQLTDAIINALVFQSDKNYAHHGRRKASYDSSRLTSDKADSTIFWPAMQCLAILLDRLQFRFWSFTTQSAENVAKSILGNPYYHLELRRWSLNGKDEEEISSSEVESEVSISEVEDDCVSNSQLVYSWGNGKKLRPREIKDTRSSQVAEHASDVCSSEKLRNAAFSWMFFLVQSLLDFGDIVSGTVGIILKALHSIYRLALAGKKSFEFFHLTSNPGTQSILPTIPKLSESALCNESLLTLSRLAELLFSNSAYMLLLKFQSQWLSDVTEAVYALLQTSGQRSKGGMQRGLQAITPLPSSLTHIVKFARSILTSSIAVEFSQSKDILSALSTSPSIKASIPKYQCSSEHSLQGMTTSDSLLNCHGISEHFLLVLEKCQSVHDSSNPYLPFSEATSFENTQPPSIEGSKSTHIMGITFPVVDAETSPVIPDPLHKTIAFSDSLDTDVTPDITSQEEDEAILEGLGPSLQVQGQSSRIQDQLESSDSSDGEICSTPLKRRPRPRSKRSNTILCRKQLNLLSEDTTDTDDFESQRIFSRRCAVPVLMKQKQLSSKKRNVKASPKSTPEKTLSSASDVTKARNEVSQYRAKNDKGKMQCTATVQSGSKSGSGKQKAKVQSLPSKKAPLQPVRTYGLHKSHVKTSISSRKGRIKTRLASHLDTTPEDDSGSSTEALSSDDLTTTDSSLQGARKVDKTNLSPVPQQKEKRPKELSHSKGKPDEEIIVISSDDSNTTEPLSPVSEDVSTGWCNQREVHSTVNSLETVTHWLEGPSQGLPQSMERSEVHSKPCENTLPISKRLDAQMDTRYVFQDLTAEAQDEHSGDHSDCSSETSMSGALLQIATIKHPDSKGIIPTQSGVHEPVEVSSTMHQTPPVLKARQHTVSPPILKTCRVDLYRIPTKGTKRSVDKLKEPAAKKLCHRQATVPHHPNARADIQRKTSVDPVHISHPESSVNQQGHHTKERKEGDQTATSVEQLLLPVSYSKMAVNRDIKTPTISETSTSESFLHVKSKSFDIQVTTQSSVQASLDPITKKLPSATAKHDHSKPNCSFLLTEQPSKTCTGPEPIPVSERTENIPVVLTPDTSKQSAETCTVSEHIPVSEISNNIPITIQYHAPDTSAKGNITPTNSRIGHKPDEQSEDRRSETTTSNDLQLISLSASEKYVTGKGTISGSITQATSLDLTTNWESTVSPFFKKLTEKHKGARQSDVFSKPSEHMPPLKKVRFDDRPKSSGLQLTSRQTATTTSYDSHRNIRFTKAVSSTQTSVIRNITMQTPDFMKPSTPPTKRPIYINIRPTSQRKMDDLFLVILSWDPARFLFPPESTDGKCIKPDLLLPEKPVAVPSVFQSYDQYCNTFTPLLHLEIWENLYQGIQDKSIQKPPSCIAKVLSITSTEQLQLIKCSSVVSHHIAQINAHPLERNLVVIDFQDLLEFACVLPMGGVESNLNMRHRFAVVESFSRSVKMPENSDKDTLGSSSVSGVEITFLLKVLSLGVVSAYSIEGRSIEINVITSLTPMIRQWNGLINLHHSQLIRDILHPRGGIYFGLNPTQQKAPREYGLLYNASQFEAIQVAAKTTCEAYANPRICLLQGPPGTGKTHTISGMIQFFFETVKPEESKRSVLPGQASSRIQPSKPHILVCSPSNAGVDEIARRLINDGLVIGTDKWTRKYGSKGSTKGAGENRNPSSTRKCSGFNVVRVGRETKIHPDVRSISLDAMARNMLAKDLNALQSLPADRIKKKLTDLQQEIDKLEKHKSMLKHSHNHSDVRSEIQKVEAELDEKMEKRIQLIRQHRQEKFKRQNSRKEETVIRRKLLTNADVVCATLVGSGSSAIMDCFKHNPLHFTCVIVDEATQCCELDVLIPLRYSSSKLILVGDPLQLPATIKSHKALSLGFGKSLFERLYTHFMNESENPIKMLQVQYRMLQEICEFPSTHFYQGKLKTHCCAKANTLTRLKPLQMFDVVQGQECQRSSSICNKEECRLVTEICQVLLDSGEVNPSGIGVITPYKSQEWEIKDCLQKQIKSSRDIDVGTVDSFQGREKDVIILSCVRAKSRTGTIGFLSSRQRMNVALTRSKRGLYILGHFESLLVNKDWRALIEHGRKSNVIVTLDRSRSYTTAASAVLRPRHTPMNVLQSAQTSDAVPVVSKHSVAVTSHSSAGEVSLNRYPKRAAESSNTPQSKRRKETTDSERYSLPTHPLHSSTARATCSTLSSTNPPLSDKIKSNVSTQQPVQSTSLTSISSQTFHRSTDSCTVQPLHTEVPDSDSSSTSESEQSQSSTASSLDRATASHTSSDLQHPQGLDYKSVFPSPPHNCPPVYDRTWRPHGGPRQRVAHKSPSTILRHRSKSLTEEETGGSPKKFVTKSSIIEKIKKRRL